LTTFFHRVLSTRAEIAPLVLRVAAGAIFFAFSFGKFVHFDAERRAFDRYGIPLADIATPAVGLLEMVGGLLLIGGLLTRPVALALAVNMAVAISTAGRIDGGLVHLGLAPGLLATMAFLVWRGGGVWSVDLRLTCAASGPSESAPASSP
jgi:putative oxidoreductase